jgi:phenylacetate-CoA ligase
VTSIIEDDGNVKEFTIKQTIDTFEIEYVSETELNLAQIKKIEAAIELYWNLILFNFIRKKKTLQRGKLLKQFTSLI